MFKISNKKQKIKKYTYTVGEAGMF
jgi:hypothetical protein